MDKITEMNIADAILERPYQFTLLRRQFSLYPMTLGKHLLMASVIERMDIDNQALKHNALLEVMRIINEKAGLVCRVIALMCAEGKAQATDEDWINDTADFFGKNLDRNDMASLFLWVLSNDKYQEFVKESGIEQEMKYMRRAQNAKESKNTYTFGGKTMYGTIIDRAAERYGWPMDYIVWGISYLNLRMLLVDSVTSIYLTDEERRKAHIPNDRTFVSADDPKNIERIMKLTQE